MHVTSRLFIYTLKALCKSSAGLPFRYNKSRYKEKSVQKNEVDTEKRGRYRKTRSIQKKDVDTEKRGRYRKTRSIQKNEVDTEKRGSIQIQKNEVDTEKTRSIKKRGRYRKTRSIQKKRSMREKSPWDVQIGRSHLDYKRTYYGPNTEIHIGRPRDILRDV